MDTGGTFTDCLAVDPQGRQHRAKVLSSSALRGRVVAVGRGGPGHLQLDFAHPLPPGFAVGARAQPLVAAAGPVRTVIAQPRADTFQLDAPYQGVGGDVVELRFDGEAPTLAARLVTSTVAGDPLPPMEMRLATTRGTNALLERRGARTVLFTTKGFGDLLRIGDQARPDLFALDIQRPEPLYAKVVEVEERLDAEGRVLRPLGLQGLEATLEELEAEGFESAAIAFLHSYRNPCHELELAQCLRRRGWPYVTSSAALAPLIKILPRAQTAVVDAYLAPVIGRYLERVAGSLPDSSRLLVMTSAGGLLERGSYHAKDSLLSGPAGGVVGASQSARALGLERLIAFDMGGTSTDVSRIEGELSYVFQHRVGDALVAAPALAIETVAAGGGSICWLDGGQAKVGPESGGAQPGPACYGAGGPLTVTDVHLLLGRLAAHRFGLPIHPQAAEEALGKLLASREADHDTASHDRPESHAFLQGFLDIANERMADAVRRISVRQGYDPRHYALLAFGGAGGLHACAVAELLAIERVLLPRDAGLLSAVGLGSALIERFAQRQILAPLEDCAPALPGILDQLRRQASDEVAQQGVPRGQIQMCRCLLFLRFVGQESSLEMPWPAAASLDTNLLETKFRQRYRHLFGYEPEGRAVEVESLRVVASSSPEPAQTCPWPQPRRPAPVAEMGQGTFQGRRQQVPIVLSGDLQDGDHVSGPALLLDDYATLVVEPGWTATVAANGTVVVERSA